MSSGPSSVVSSSTSQIDVNISNIRKFKEAISYIYNQRSTGASFNSYDVKNKIKNLKVEDRLMKLKEYIVSKDTLPYSDKALFDFKGFKELESQAHRFENQKAEKEAVEKIYMKIYERLAKEIMDEIHEQDARWLEKAGSVALANRALRKTLGLSDSNKQSGSFIGDGRNSSEITNFTES